MNINLIPTVPSFTVGSDALFGGRASKIMDGYACAERTPVTTWHPGTPVWSPPT